MPSKPKLHKLSGKSKTPIIATSSQVNTSNQNNVAGDSETARQFELELCWCIQQLQLALNSGKLNPKQAQDHVKACNTLMSNTAPMVKKRQVMRNSFGDYRSKMTTESQRLSKGLAQFKVAPGKPNKKSYFVKKSIFTSKPKDSFKFNFNESVEEGDEISTVDDNKSENSNLINFHFQNTDNSFRFNFKNEIDVDNVKNESDDDSADVKCIN